MAGGRRTKFWKLLVFAVAACVLAGATLFAMLWARSSDTGVETGVETGAETGAETGSDTGTETGAETSVYVNIEQTSEDYLVFCCFTVGSDIDPMSEYNRRKAAALTIDALRRYLKLPAEATIRPRHVTREREPERNGGVMLYYYRVPIGSCEIRGVK